MFFLLLSKVALLSLLPLSGPSLTSISVSLRNRTPFPLSPRADPPSGSKRAFPLFLLEASPPPHPPPFPFVKNLFLFPLRRSGPLLELPFGVRGRNPFSLKKTFSDPKSGSFSFSPGVNSKSSPPFSNDFSSFFRPCIGFPGTHSFSFIRFPPFHPRLE